MTKFQKSWEKCFQGEERIAVKEEKLNESDDQALTVHTKGKNKRKSYDHPPREVQGFKKNKKFKKDFSAMKPDSSKRACVSRVRVSDTDTLTKRVRHVFAACPVFRHACPSVSYFWTRVSEDC